MFRISGGSYTAPKEFPWMVRLLGGCAASMCGGALVSPRIVLTAHHCTTNHFEESTKSCDHSDERRIAILGTNIIYEEDIPNYYTIPVVEVRSPPNAWLTHDDFDSHDFAMAILKHPAKYDDYVRPICLPHLNAEHGGKFATAAGWGKTDRPSISRHQSPRLKSVRLEVDSWKYMHTLMFGTLLSKKYNKYQDPYSGDSGYSIILAMITGQGGLFI